MSGARNLEGLKMQVLTCIEAAYDKGYKSGLNDGNINKETFAAKVKEAYNNGLNDAEKARVRLISAVSDGGLSTDEIIDIFDATDYESVFENFTICEIIEKIRKYDEKKRLNERCDTCKYQHSNRGFFPCCDCCDNDRWESKEDNKINVGDEIHVGDEIYCLDSKYKYAVLGFIDNDKIFVFSSRGFTGVFASKQVHKTGRNYPVAEILKSLSEEHENDCNRLH